LIDHVMAADSLDSESITKDNFHLVDSVVEALRYCMDTFYFSFNFFYK